MKAKEIWGDPLCVTTGSAQAGWYQVDLPTHSNSLVHEVLFKVMLGKEVVCQRAGFRRKFLR